MVGWGVGGFFEVGVEVGEEGIGVLSDFVGLVGSFCLIGSMEFVVEVLKSV